MNDFPLLIGANIALHAVQKGIQILRLYPIENLQISVAKEFIPLQMLLLFLFPAVHGSKGTMLMGVEPMSAIAFMRIPRAAARMLMIAFSTLTALLSTILFFLHFLTHFSSLLFFIYFLKFYI